MFTLCIWKCIVQNQNGSNLEQILEQVHGVVLLNSDAFKALQSSSPQAGGMQHQDKIPISGTRVCS